MTESNAELAGRIIRDFAELIEHLNPDVVWDNTHTVPPDHHGIHRGKPEVARIITEWVESWDEYRIMVDEVIDAGDDVVLVVTESGTGRESGVPLEHHHCYIWSFRDGRIVWGTARPSKAEAFELIAERNSPQ